MNFILHALLTIFLHIAPNAIGAGLSIYHHHGIHVDRVHHQHHRRHHR